MTLNRLIIVALLLLPVFGALADCPRVPGEEDDRRANAGCLIVQGDKVLLITHRWGGKLGVPGGTLEAGELAQCTAYRETREETGIEVVVGPRVRVMKNGFHLYRCYPADAQTVNAPLPVPESSRLEVSAMGWYSPAQLRKDDWRFPYQFELFLNVLDEQLSLPPSP